MVDAAVYAEFGDVDGWVAALTALDDPVVYAARSAAVFERAAGNRDATSGRLTRFTMRCARRLPRLIRQLNGSCLTMRRTRCCVRVCGCGWVAICC